MSVKEISRATLSEALLSKHPPVVLEALDRKYYDDGHIPTARLLPARISFAYPSGDCP